MKRIYFLALLLWGFVCLSAAENKTPAFPGAEGGGMYTTGGRGGAVYYVNTLSDEAKGNKKTREGSLRWCLKQPGPKNILFKVGGIIRLSAPLVIGERTTLAGQTAPGDGICIAGYPVKIKGDEVVVRFLRFRMGDLNKVENDAFYGTQNRNVIIDHCSVSWGTDECASFYDNTNFTMQWCIISESLRASVHQKGNHGYCAIWGGKTATFHHNLLAHHDSRNPRMCGSRYSAQPELERVDFRNNVIYNWGSNSGYAGEGGCYNFINNYYKPGKESSNRIRIFAPGADNGENKQEKGVWGCFYLSGNVVEGCPEVTRDNLLGFQPNPDTINKADILSEEPFEMPFVSTDSAEEAYRKVLNSAGASYRRDNTDKRIVHEVIHGLAPCRASGKANTKAGLIDSQEDVGGWGTYEYKPEEVPVDTNRDGIPDGWLEKLYPGKQANDVAPSGYTYLEIYLNSILKEEDEK